MFLLFFWFSMLISFLFSYFKIGRKSLVSFSLLLSASWLAKVGFIYSSWGLAQWFLHNSWSTWKSAPAPVIAFFVKYTIISKFSLSLSLYLHWNKKQTLKINLIHFYLSHVPDRFQRQGVYHGESEGAKLGTWLLDFSVIFQSLQCDCRPYIVTIATVLTFFPTSCCEPFPSKAHKFWYFLWFLFSLWCIWTLEETSASFVLLWRSCGDKCGPIWCPDWWV